MLTFLSSLTAQESKPRVIVFGVDGLNVYRFDEVETPNFDYMKAHGSWTLKAQANDPLSSSPNWKSILTGTTPDVHRVLQNGFDKNCYINNPSCETELESFPTIFTMLRRFKPKARMGVFRQWGAFGRLLKGDRLNRNLWWAISPGPNVRSAINYYRNFNSDLTFIHIDNCDYAGHAHGHESNEYLKAVKKADNLLGKVIRAIEKEDGFRNTTLIVIADHGGKGKGHGSGTPEGMIIPFLIMGSNIKHNHEIEVVVKNEDVAVMVAGSLGFKPHECVTAKSISEVYLEE